MNWPEIVLLMLKEVIEALIVDELASRAREFLRRRARRRRVVRYLSTARRRQPH